MQNIRLIFHQNSASLVADHIFLCKEVEQSLHDDSVVCVVTDVGTGWVMAYPAKTKNTNATKRAFMHFAGTEDKIARLYCDNAKELEKPAAAQLEWHVDTSTMVSQNDPTDESLTELEPCCMHLDFRIDFWAMLVNAFAPCGISMTKIVTPRALMNTVMARYFMA